MRLVILIIIIYEYICFSLRMMCLVFISLKFDETNLMSCMLDAEKLFLAGIKAFETWPDIELEEV